MVSSEFRCNMGNFVTTRMISLQAAGWGRQNVAGRAISWRNVKTLLSYGTRGKFPRVLNRRLSHWLYGAITAWLERRCEESGIRLVRKDPWKTSQRCSKCGKWDKRSRKGDRFCCVTCGFTDHADLNAPKNLVFLELAGAYSLRSLPN